MEIVLTVMARHISFILFSGILVIAFFMPLKELWTLSSESELYSHIILIPLISAYFFYLKRKEIFTNAAYSFKVGIFLIILAGIMYFTAMFQAGILSQNDYLSLMTFSAVLSWTGGFIFFYGLETLKDARFPLLFLLFMVPIPDMVVGRIISILQWGSAEAAFGLLKLTGVPVLREGFVFHLPSLSVEVAEQCSGIRSSIALFITSVIAGKLFLATGWRRVILALSVFPIAVAKNSLRIVTLTLLGAYVDERILDSTLHRRGGIPFFIISLLLLFPVLWALRGSEKKQE